MRRRRGPSAPMLFALLISAFLAACGDSPRSQRDTEAVGSESDTAAVELDSSAVLSGQITYRERIALPPEAIIRVRLEQVPALNGLSVDGADPDGAVANGAAPDGAVADRPAAVLSADTIAAGGRQVPIPFSLEYDPTEVDSAARYVVRAEISDSSGGAPRWHSEAPPLVLTYDAPSTDVEVMVSSVADTTDAETNPDLISARRVWERARLRGIDFRAVGNEPGWLLEIDEDTRLLFTYDYGRERVTAPAPAPSSSESSGQTVYRVVTDSLELSFTITREPCMDTMSGEQFEAAVTVEFGGRTYTGCGRFLRSNR